MTPKFGILIACLVISLLAEQVLAEIVRVDFYYESLCPYCKDEYPQLLELANKLGTQVDIHTYPYGNGETENQGGEIIVSCQHGDEECYGNKLHACAIDQIKDVSCLINFNACLMASDSDDAAAKNCCRKYKVDYNSLKTCASGPRGQELLINYGKQTEKAGLNVVPYVLINGNLENTDRTLFNAVCSAFVSRPQCCS